MFFDGSDVGLNDVDVDAFYIVDADTLLISIDVDTTIGSLVVDDQDILEFTATTPFGEVTAGSFSMYFDGSDVGLDNNNEDIVALDLRDGKLLIATRGNIVVPGVSGRDEDILAFTPTSLGENTAGAWAMYFDGSDVGLSTGGEDIDALSIDTSGKIYISTVDAFSVTNISGNDEDIFFCTPASLGDNTTCTFSPTLFFDGSSWGLDADDVDGITLP